MEIRQNGPDHWNQLIKWTEAVIQGVKKSVSREISGDFITDDKGTSSDTAKRIVPLNSLCGIGLETTRNEVLTVVSGCVTHGGKMRLNQSRYGKAVGTIGFSASNSLRQGGKIGSGGISGYSITDDK